jgi:hypothetical protein
VALCQGRRKLGNLLSHKWAQKAADHLSESRPHEPDSEP